MDQLSQITGIENAAQLTEAVGALVTTEDEGVFGNNAAEKIAEMLISFGAFATISTGATVDRQAMVYVALIPERGVERVLAIAESIGAITRYPDSERWQVADVMEKLLG